MSWLNLFYFSSRLNINFTEMLQKWKITSNLPLCEYIFPHWTIIFLYGYSICCYVFLFSCLFVYLRRRCCFFKFFINSISCNWLSEYIVDRLCCLPDALLILWFKKCVFSHFVYILETSFLCLCIIVVLG